MMIGELSALGGSCCWATCSTLFAFSARILGIYALNLVRLSFALLFLTLALWIITGSPVPADATGEDWFWLALSAVIGLVIGDLFYFGALKSIGPRVTMLLFTLAPPVAAVGEWVVFGAGLSSLALLGMGIALSGVILVITDRKEKENNSVFKLSLKGILLGAGGSVCQGLGLVLSKMGLAEIDALSGTFIRMLAAASVFAVIYFFMGGKLSKIVRERRGLLYAVGGAFFGPFLGVTLSLAAVKHTHSGIAMTILSTTPITILPFSVLVYKEKLSPRAVLGAFVAVGGISLLFLPF
jgi:drug/metabolite transporter (DMT)-like permease